MKNKIRLLGVGLALAVLPCRSDDNAKPAPAIGALVTHVASHRDGSAAWSIDFSKLEGDRASLPIGVFDSGIGGLTVMEAILKLDAFNNRTLQPGADGVPDFAGEKFIYLGDQANMPYGNYPAKGHEDYLHELIVKDVVFLLGGRHHARGEVLYNKPPVKAVVIACNTATAYGLGDIRAALRAWRIEVPVVGVVEAGARAVSERLPTEGTGGAVAVLATVGTCQAGAYPKAIQRAGGLAGKSIPKMVQQGCVGLAGAIEGNPAFVSSSADGAAKAVPYLGPAVGNPDAPLDPALVGAYDFDPAGIVGDPSKPATWRLNSVSNYARYEVATLVESYRANGGGPPIATVVLGCTHFPIVEREIAGAIARLREYRAADGTQPYQALIAGQVSFSNPAEFTAKELFRELARGRLRAAKDSRNPPVLAAVFISVPNLKWPGAKLAADGSFDADYKYSRSAGHPADEDTWIVPFAECAVVAEFAARAFGRAAGSLGGVEPAGGRRTLTAARGSIGAAEVAAVFGFDADFVAVVDEEGHLDDQAGLEGGGLVDIVGGIAAHALGRIRDFEDDGRREFDAGDAFVGEDDEILLAFDEVVLHGSDHAFREHHVLIGGGVDEVVAVAILVAVVVCVLVEVHGVERLIGGQAEVVDLAVGDAADGHLDIRSHARGLLVLHLGDGADVVVVADGVSLAKVDDGGVGHGRVECLGRNPAKRKREGDGRGRVRGFRRRAARWCPALKWVEPLAP